MAHKPLSGRTKPKRSTSLRSQMKREKRSRQQSVIGKEAAKEKKQEKAKLRQLREAAIAAQSAARRAAAGGDKKEAQAATKAAAKASAVAKAAAAEVHAWPARRKKEPKTAEPKSAPPKKKPKLAEAPAEGPEAAPAATPAAEAAVEPAAPPAEPPASPPAAEPAASPAVAPATAPAAASAAPAKPAEQPPAPAPAPKPARPVEKKLGKKEKRQLHKQAQQEKALRSLYTGGHTLLVGEGNFSFARALCRHLGTGERVIATCLDGESVLGRKYPDVSECRKEVEDKFGGTTLCGVDATRLHEVREFRHSFNIIVWNFPHIGGREPNVEKSVADHQSLLASFFKSAVCCLTIEEPSSLHVVLKSGEPYKSWKIVTTARSACPELELQKVLPFYAGAWEGYEHRRTVGFDERFSKKDNEELAKGAKVYVFALKKEAVAS